jgi:hypothetical protein
MAIQSREFRTRLEALHLDEAEREEAEYHRFLIEIAKPVDAAVAALRRAADEGWCGLWADENHQVFQRAYDELSASEPPKLLAVYRNQLLGAVEVFLQASDEWRDEDPLKTAESAVEAAAAWREAEDLEDGLL